MTITPLGSAVAAETRATIRGGTGADAAVGGFGALIAAQLAALHLAGSETPGDLVVAGSSGKTEEVLDEDADLVSGSDEAEGSESADVVPPVVVPGLTIPPRAGAAVTGEPADGQDPSSVVATAAGGGDVAEASAETTEQDGEPAAGPGRTPTAAQPGDGDGVAAPSTSRTAPATTTGAEGTAVTAGPKPESPGQPDPATAPVGATAATGSTAAATPTAPTTAGTSTGSAVTSQVFPTVPALVSRGEGTHSITLRLHPADLGEVHVTVTVRNGNVEVTLAAGREAQEALRTGSGELRSLLDLAGSATGQVVVRDLPSGAPTAPTATTSSFQLPTGGAAAGEHDRGAEHGAEGNPTDRRPRGEQPGDGTPNTGTPRQTTRTTTGLDLTL